MELDDLKQAWQTLDRRLQQQHALDLELRRSRELDKVRHHLRPLWWGQLAQMLFGFACVLLGAGCWSNHPDQWPLWLAGGVMHAYGLATMIAGGITLGLVARLDHAAPVLRIQKQYARLRRFYVVSGMAVGLAWWVLWVPFVMALAGLDPRTDARVFMQPWVYAGLACGVAGLLGTWWFHRWARHPERPRLARALEASLTGASLRRARQRLDELARFEAE